MKVKAWANRISRGSRADQDQGGSERTREHPASWWKESPGHKVTQGKVKDESQCPDLMECFFVSISLLMFKS